MGVDFLLLESIIVKIKSLGFQSRSLGVGFEHLEVKFWFWQYFFGSVWVDVWRDRANRYGGKVGLLVYIMSLLESISGFWQSVWGLWEWMLGIWESIFPLDIRNLVLVKKFENSLFRPKLSHFWSEIDF